MSSFPKRDNMIAKVRQLSFAFTALVLMISSQLSIAQTQDNYPDGVNEIQYKSAADDSMQPALFWAPKNATASTSGDDTQAKGGVPLLVALHTWSSNFQQAGSETVYARWCQAAGWAFVHPNFRGSNTQGNPEAMGSELAVEDIASAVEYAKSVANIDVDRVYCVGVSGGGHASLMMAARKPKIWAGVSAWCGISDIAAWHRQCNGSKFETYAKHIELTLGGPPDTKDREQDARSRSPISWLKADADLPTLDINHGINDGRAGSVPFSHSLNAWNACVAQTQRFPPAMIDAFYKNQAVPDAFTSKNLAQASPLFGKNTPVFQTTSDGVRLTIFQGGHEIVHNAALNWLAAQRRGAPAVWKTPVFISLDAANKQDSGR